jgi:hypothetical protein
VVAAIIVLLAAVLLNAVYYVQEKAERTVIEATVLNIEKGLEIEVRTREIRGLGSAEELAGGHTGGSAVVGGIRVFSTTSFVWH